ERVAVLVHLGAGGLFDGGRDGGVLRLFAGGQGGHGGDQGEGEQAAVGGIHGVVVLVVVSVNTRSAPSAGQQLAQPALQGTPLRSQVVAFLAPMRAARRHLAPEPLRVVGVQQVAQLVDQHVFERRRPRQQQRQVQRQRAVRG